MKKTNTVQLIIAGIVVVLVAICGTFAWFAESDSALVSQIGATAASPSIESGVSEIQYNVNGEWNTYDGSVPLSLTPGQVINFRVIFYAGSSQNVTVKMTDIATTDGGKTYDFTDKYSTAGALPLLCEALEYRVKFSDADSGDYSVLKDDIYFDGSNENKPAAVVYGPQTVDESALSGQQYIYYYDLTLPGSAGNEYQDQTINFDLELTIS